MAEDIGGAYTGAAQGAAAGSMISPGVGTVIGGLIGAVGGFLSNKSNAKAAKEQMKWQEYMSSTAHQREVADLRAAGLNPILSATGGSGASTPSGASYQASNIGDSAVSGAKQGGRLSAEVDLLRAQEAANLATSLNQTQEARNKAAQQPELDRVAEIYRDPTLGPKAAAAKVSQQSNLLNKIIGTAAEGGIYNSARDAASKGFEKVEEFIKEKMGAGQGVSSGKALERALDPRNYKGPPQYAPKNRVTGKIRGPSQYSTPWGDYEGVE